MSFYQSTQANLCLMTYTRFIFSAQNTTENHTKAFIKWINASPDAYTIFMSVIIFSCLWSLYFYRLVFEMLSFRFNSKSSASQRGIFISSLSFPLSFIHLERYLLLPINSFNGKLDSFHMRRFTIYQMLAKFIFLKIGPACLHNSLSHTTIALHHKQAINYHFLLVKQMRPKWPKFPGIYFSNSGNLLYLCLA